MAFKPVSKPQATDRFKFENPGDQMEGYYLGSETFDYNGSELTKHTFQKADGTVVSTIGSHKLNEELATVDAGMRTRITFTGVKKLKGGKTMKDYNVEVDAEDVLAGRQPSAVHSPAQASAPAKADPATVAAQLKGKAIR